MSNKIILIGGFIEIIELCEENGIEILGIVDNIKSKEFLTYNIIGDDNNVDHWKSKNLSTPLIITPDLPNVRKKLSFFYQNLGFTFSTIISKWAHISKSAIINRGTVVQSGANISSESLIGEFVKINNNANIMHNVVIGNYSTIAPNAVLLGHVKIGEGCYIGANATILPYINICDNVTIGAGAVVTKNIELPFSTHIGIPAKKLK